MGRFETEFLAVHDRRPPKQVVLDLDSSVIPTYGDQEGTAYNGHFGCTCYHPLFLFNQLGDLERCSLHPGNVHSAHNWRDVLEPVVARYRDQRLRRYFRGDAAYASPDIYEFLEARERRRPPRSRSGHALGCRAASSITTSSASKFMRSPTTSPNSCGPWHCRSRWSIGR